VNTIRIEIYEHKIAIVLCSLKLLHMARSCLSVHISYH